MKQKTRQKRKIKKSQIVLLIVIIFLGLSALGTAIAYSHWVTANTVNPFVRERQHTGRVLYNETLGINIAENYPTTPRGVMELYAAAVFLLYGNFIAVDDVFMEVIEFQRSLFSPELQSVNTPEQQYENLMESIDILNEARIMPRRPAIHEIVNDYIDGNSVLAQVRLPLMGLDSDLFRLYLLKLDEDDKWRIHSWKETDENFSLGDDF